MRQLLPAKDKIALQALDTSRYERRPFLLGDIASKTLHINGKKIIEPIVGDDISQMIKTRGRYLLYFWNPGCPATLPEIHKMDSISKTGENVIIISIAKKYDVIESTLSKTSFAKYPIYSIENSSYSNILLVRKAAFIKEACSQCYATYRDELIFTNYLMIENGTVTAILK